MMLVVQPMSPAPLNSGTPIAHLRNEVLRGLLLVAALMVLGGCTSGPRIGERLKPFGGASKPDVADSSSGSPSGVKPVSYEEDGDSVKPLELTDFSPKKISETSKRLTGRGPNRRIAEATYSEGDALYKQALNTEGAKRNELFVMAAKKFLSAADRLPKSALEQDALFMAGESFFFADHYSKANDAYERLIKAHSNNRYLDAAEARRFAIAKYWLELHRKNPESFFEVNFYDEERPWRDTRGHGLRVFDRIRHDDPTGRLADDATLAAGNEHFAAKNFSKADEFYTDLRSAYPASEHQFSAHFLGLKAKLNTYMGPDYTGTMLADGEKLIKQMRRQFPKESAAEREFLDRAAAEIRFKQSERLWNLAEYHHRRGEYRAASHYAGRIVKEYSDTPFVEKAAGMSKEVEGLPPVPEQKLKWLVDALPRRDNVENILRANEQAQKTPTSEPSTPEVRVAETPAYDSTSTR